MIPAHYDLLLDLGNSRLKWATSAADHWQWQAMEYAAGDVAQQLTRAWQPLPPPRQVVVASVAAAEVLRTLQQWVHERWGRECHVVTSQAEQLGVRNRYHAPEQLGSDRWAALLAARQSSAGAVCVVDCGTAVTLDLLTAQGEFAGGVIFPGLGLLRRTLAQGTQALASLSAGDAAALPARSTADGVASGTQIGLCGAIERIIAEYRRQQAPNGTLKVVLCGGDAPLLLPLLTGIDQHVPDLVLRGLALLARGRP